MSERRKQIVRVLLGVLFSPLIGLLGGLVVFNLRHPDAVGWLGGQFSRFSASVMYLEYFAVWAYPGMIVLGIPTYLWFESQKWRSTWHYCLAGLIGGVLVIALRVNILSLCRPMRISLPLRARLLPYGFLHPGIVGLLIGISFWLITVYRHNNRIERTPDSAPAARGDAHA
ncbi:hypothetical protein BVX94_03615 [bacterium B17]|nr:hypothetical protein BVX94_03615 [bacterium B17]